MAKAIAGVLSPLVGKTGPVITRNWRGKQIQQAYNPFDIGKDTPKRILQRKKFGVLARTGGQLMPIVRKGYNYKALKQSTTEMGLFIRENNDTVTGATPETLVVDISQLVVSKGCVVPVINEAMLYDSTLKMLDVRFNPNDAIPMAWNTDEVYCGLYCPDEKISTLSNSAYRYDRITVIAVPEMMYGHEVHVWCFVIGALDNTCYANQASISHYLGSFTA